MTDTPPRAPSKSKSEPSSAHRGGHHRSNSWDDSIDNRLATVSSSDLKKISFLLTPLTSALGESSSFPHVPKCVHCRSTLREAEARWGTGLCDECYTRVDKVCGLCDSLIPKRQLRWGSAMCDTCYDLCAKVCEGCKRTIPPPQLRWGSGLCDGCYDSACGRICQKCGKQMRPSGRLWGSIHCETCSAGPAVACVRCARTLELHQIEVGLAFCAECYHETKPRITPGLSAGVRVAIGSQLIFYLAPAMLLPSLYLRVALNVGGLGEDANDAAALGGGGDADAAFAAVLTASSVMSMLAPLPLGLWATHRGEREVYLGVTVVAAAAAVGLAYVEDTVSFALCWGLLSAPPSMRGVRAAYFARTVAPDELSRAGQLASALGLVGSVVGPLVAAADRSLFFGHLSGSWWAASMLAAASHLACAIALGAWLPAMAPAPDDGSAVTLRRSFSGTKVAEAVALCERCDRPMEAHEAKWGTSLCNDCYNDWFKHYKRRLLLGFCLVAGLLEVSVNAGVIATFQPLAVGRFGWGEAQIAWVNTAAATLSVALSVTMAQLNFPARVQAAAAAALYLGAVGLYAAPPLTEWRLVAGLMLGLKAQILFMAPFTAAFSRLIGGTRVTNTLTAALCSAPLVGASLGTAAAPLFLAAADTPLSLLVALPSVVAICLMWSGWKDTAEGVPRTRSQMPMAKHVASMLREPLIEGRPPGHEA